jgi:hypothetical protein
MQNGIQESESAASFRPSLSLPFSEFLAALIQALEEEGLRPCILRNYEGFPNENVGGDVDFLIRPSDLPRAVRALRFIEGVRIVGYAEHPHVVSVFLAGTSSTPGSRSLQVDFFGKLGWKGLPYLPVDAVLQAAITRSAGNLNFLVPSTVHEAIISLLTNLLISGWLKEKYLPKVQGTFASHRLEVIGDLLPQFDLKAATRLVDSVIDGDRQNVLDCVGSLRASLVVRSLLRMPYRSISAIARHYTMEFSALYLPESLESVCILGTEGSGKTRLIESLIPILQSSAKVVENRPAKLLLTLGRPPGNMAESADPRAGVPSGPLVSMANVVLWQLEEWVSQFRRTRNLLLRICEGYYHDLLIDPKKYSYSGPMWFARLVGALLPTHDLWILLDPSSDGMQSEIQQGALAKTHAQLEAYRSFVRTRKRYVILDASCPAANVREGAYTAIIDTLADRAERKLKNRFQKRKSSN